MTAYMDEDIAIVGLGLRFPGDASDPEQFYDFLLRGRSSRNEIPSDRWNKEAFYHPDHNHAGTMSMRHAHFLDGDISKFDAPFFSISANEAGYMDPQQRLLLETVYHAIENAGISMDKVVGSNTSVHIGCFNNDYEKMLSWDPEVDLTYLPSGVGSAMLSNRLSWFYDFKGPSITLDTACSSSLNAVYLGYNALRNKEVDMAVAGGCNLFFMPDTSIYLDDQGFLSPDGICYTFDHRANGYARGEGLGIVVLKRLSDAIRDGNTIRAVIRGMASNQDGRSPGLTQPTRASQAAMIRQAYQNAKLTPEDTFFFESHGTGTQLGDPIEAAAISDVFTEWRSVDSPLYVGALKTNIGHLEATAGVAGLIKAIGVVERGIIPANLHMERVNPKIPATEWHLKFPTENTLWPGSAALRRASVNTFGFGGSNVHAIIDDAYSYLASRNINGLHRTVVHPKLARYLAAPNDKPANGKPANEEVLPSLPSERVPNGHPRPETNPGNTQDAMQAEKTKRLFVWSAYDEEGVARVIESQRSYLDKQVELDNIHPDDEEYLSDLAYTLASKRTHFPWRGSMVANSLTSLLSSMTSPGPPVQARKGGKVGLVFTGQGAQWTAMGRELATIDIFCRSLEDATTYLTDELGCSWSLQQKLLTEEDATFMDDAMYSQPICTALQVALVDVLRHFGILFDAVVGHSSGEIAAAYAAGVISSHDAWKIAYYRGLFSNELAKSASEGAMLSVALDAEQVTDHIKTIRAKHPGTLVIACYNSPTNVTVSGDTESVEELKQLLDELSVFNRRLKVNNAYHSPYMEQISDKYRDAMGSLEPKSLDTSGIRYYSSLTGGMLPPRMLQSPDYWVDNLVSPVKFTDALSSMLTTGRKKAKKLGAVTTATLEPITALVEVGPHSTLKGPIRQIMGKLPNVNDVEYTSLLERNTGAVDSFLSAAGWLHNRGLAVDVGGINMRHGENTSQRHPAMLVTLPQYPFNHSKSHWRESRLSKGRRFRKHPRLHLLGSPVPDWNKSNAVWRNWIRLSESPWIEDHSITGTVIYPGAAMLAMAIEASLQLVTPTKVLRGIRIRNIAFMAAMRIPKTSEGAETQLCVRPHFDSLSSASSNWNEFELSSYDGQEWRVHCRGLIQPDYETPINPIDEGAEERYRINSIREAVEEAEITCGTTISRAQLYEILGTVGTQWGPSFQTVYDIAINDDLGAVATVREPDSELLGNPEEPIQPHLIHPTTLDGIFQLSTAAYTRGGRESIEAYIPESIAEIWISADADASYSSLRIASKSETYSLRQYTSSTRGIDSRTRKPLFTLDGFLLTAVSSQAKEIEQDSHYHISYNVDWKPDVTFLKQSSLSTNALALPDELARKDPTEIIARLEALCFTYLRRYLERVHTPEHVDQSKPWLQKYIHWAKYQLELYFRGELLHATPEWEVLAKDDAALAALEAELEQMCPEGPLTTALCRSLGDILAGSVDPLETVFKPELLEPVYDHGTGIEIGNAYMSMYFDMLAHKNSNLTILEIGAGTGGATLPIIKTLCNHGTATPRFERYDFTDVSPAFLEPAKEKFQNMADRMRFQTLDIEKDPLKQGFEAEQYDVILAANVLHATKNIDHTLSMVRKMLKPGGKLVLYEVTGVLAVRSTFTFGLLPGWWLSDEPSRRWGAPLSPDEWELHLKRNGFSGIDLNFPDSTVEKNHLHDVVVSTASETQSPSRPLPSTVIVIREESKMQRDIAGSLRDSLSSLSPGSECEVIPIEQLLPVDWTQKLCIFLCDVGNTTLIDQLDPSTFKALQKMLAVADSAVWLSEGGGPAPRNPKSDLITGFARVARQENPQLKFIVLSIESITKATAAANSLLTIINNTLCARRDMPNVVDNSFHETADGVIHIGRLVEATYMNDTIVHKTTNSPPQPGEFGADPTRALKLAIGSPGLLETLCFVDDPNHDQPLQEGEVEYKVMAAGLNFVDVMVSLGQVPGLDLGIEGSGIVTRTGPNTKKFKVGDRVCGNGRGSIATYTRVHEKYLSKMPENMSFAFAAGFGVVFITAYVAIYEAASVQPGDTILIHAGAGGVGQACIQLAKIRGAEIYATVGSIAKRDLLINQYGIPKDHIFSSRDLTFSQGVRRMTKGRGIDVVINSLSGDALRATWDLMAPFGRFVEIGKVDVYTSAYLQMNKFKNCVRFEFVDLNYMARSGDARFSRHLASLMTLVEQGKIGDLVPMTQVPFSEVQVAIRSMQSGTNTGKFVLIPGEKDIVPIVPSRKSLYDLHPDASYVVSGGFGGIGKSICRWMASCGARFLIILSRSGPSNAESRDLVKELESSGVTIKCPKCDISNAGALQRALDECLAQGMPPVKGCIQASMVLRDAMFLNMSLEDYHAALGPKVQGSWNLHNLLPKDLDFFVLLSSIAGIMGNQGQANYAVGNTFQDALARHRVLNGLKAVSIDVGSVLSVGYVAEQSQHARDEGGTELDLASHMQRMGVQGMREDELLAVIEAACDPGQPLANLSNLKMQVVLGLQVPEVFKTSALEEPMWFYDPLFTHLHRIRLHGGDGRGTGDEHGRSKNYGLLLAAAESVDAAAEVVYGALADKLVRALNITPSEVDPGKPLTALGVDSLVSVEIRTFILKQLQADLSVFDLMEARSLKELSNIVVSRSRLTITKEEEEEKDG
ncbi:fatty acid synthase S-acetyltransferase [Trichoderma chlorosporum]